MFVRCDTVPTVTNDSEDFEEGAGETKTQSPEWTFGIIMEVCSCFCSCFMIVLSFVLVLYSVLRGSCSCFMILLHSQCAPCSCSLVCFVLQLHDRAPWSCSTVCFVFVLPSVLRALASCPYSTVIVLQVQQRDDGCCKRVSFTRRVSDTLSVSSKMKFYGPYRSEYKRLLEYKRQPPLVLLGTGTLFDFTKY